MPRVSVVIPNYNHSRYLPRRLSSVVEQTFGDLEVLFLDDKSPDNSREVFQNHPASQDPRVRSIFNATNSGSTFKQWNLGVRETCGEYLWFAESDDYADPRFLEVLVAQLDAHPDAGMAYCQSWQIDKDDQVLASFRQFTDHLDPEHWREDFVASGRHECARYLIHQNIIPNASGVLLRRSVLERVGPAPEAMKVCGDWMFYARILLASDVVFVAREWNYFRTHTANVRTYTTRAGLGLEEAFRVQNQIARTLNLDAGPRRRVAEAMAWNWMQGLDHSLGGGIPWKRHLRLMRLMATMHARTALPIVVRVVARSLVHRLRLRGLVRRLRPSLRRPATVGTDL